MRILMFTFLILAVVGVGVVIVTAYGHKSAYCHINDLLIHFTIQLSL